MVEHEIIQSRQNTKIKLWRKLLTAKGRKQQGHFLIEGTHLVEEALKYAQRFVELLVTPEYLESSEWSLLAKYLPVNLQPVLVAADVLKSLSATETHQGVIAVLDLPKKIESWQPNGSKYLLLDSVQDPGNLGTMIRTADAAGFDGVLLGQGTVDVYNDKVLRATQGSIWHLEVISISLDKAYDALKAVAIPIYATALHQTAIEYHSITKISKAAIVMGNEGAGVAQKWIELADQAIYIPMPGQAESLNVAVAAGILMFKFAS